MLLFEFVETLFYLLSNSVCLDLINTEKLVLLLKA